MSTYIRHALIALIILLLVSASGVTSAQALRGGNAPYDSVAKRILETGLKDLEAFSMLQELTSKAGLRLSGSEGAAKAVELTRQMMERRGFDNVHLERVIVPHWVRGPVEEATVVKTASRDAIPLTICALGGSIATPPDGIEAEVVEVKSLDDVKALGTKVRGKIVFYNRPLDPTKLGTFEAYSGAVDQRSRGAIEAAKVRGVAVLVRSMTLALDDVPHTGHMNYADTVRKIPAAAVSTVDANLLSELLKREKTARVNLKLTCQTLPDVESANVIGQITGSEKPDEIIVVGGHLDSWDKGTGAHDDGAGCMQAIEVLNILRKSGIKPKRTIRAVMFINEENGQRGGKAYPLALERKGETHVAALESDRGGFAPRGFTVHGDSTLLEKVLKWKTLFEQLNAGHISNGGSGTDVSPLVEKGAAGFGLLVEDHRYFDYHHSDNDTIDKVNPRELEMGAIVEALLCYLISEEGL
jgi:hypothetical protein